MKTESHFPVDTKRISILYFFEHETHRFEDLLVRLVVDAVPQGVVDSVVFAFASADVLDTRNTDT